MRREINQALIHIRYISAHCARETLIETIRDEWKFIATVIDRLQFVIFSTVTAIGSLALLCQVKFIKMIEFSFVYLFVIGTTYVSMGYK